MDSQNPPTDDVELDVSPGIDRRTLIKRAAAAGAIAWTAPIILNSFASPAAAASGCAIAITALGTPYANATDQASYTSTSFGPSTAGALVLLFFMGDKVKDGFTISGGPISGSWTLIKSVGVKASTDKVLHAYRGVGNGSSGAVTISFTTTKDGKDVVLMAAQATCTDGTTPIAASVTASGDKSTAVTATFPAPTKADNAQIFVVANDGAATWTPPGTFTEISGHDAAAGNSMEWSYRLAAASGAVTAVPSVTDKTWAAIALEINSTP